VVVVEEAVVRGTFDDDFGTAMELDASRTDCAHEVVDGHNLAFVKVSFVKWMGDTEGSQYK
jgi:hypothetical protein